ncbi:hypothetical protein J7T55_008135 [Diaporthe amygdali]|uniref:uncharacterized protein n=1 Tax=Phomopsis amygdali TaxID=1214568 RepID=UPI0022FF0475|nr:uncharacterized protein J7T55_008135 [Diaporthe amygdali]KAJ0107999.1 hypothetical protein J7T55_008135 [Diaporthe amygdali]
MALIGISLIVASVVFFCLRPPAWLPLPNLLFSSRHHRARIDNPQNSTEQPLQPTRDARLRDGDGHSDGDSDGDGQATPRAAACTTNPAHAIPSFSLSEPLPSPSPSPSPSTSQPTRPAIPPPSDSGQIPRSPLPLQPTQAIRAPTASDLMPPPPPPPPSSSGSLSPAVMAPPPKPAINARRIPTLAPVSSNSSSLRPPQAPSPNRSLPVPSRAPGTSTLAPPPTHSSVPTKPSKQVKLTPGHSPMDWARLAQSPTSDLRGLPPSTPYLRVTPSQLRQMTGRKGKDAWSVFSGKVYNISPYIGFHPGGEAELLRGAGRDGTRMFAEVHPWVNYETMLSACLIGILVDEHEVEHHVGKAMEEMD